MLGPSRKCSIPVVGHYSHRHMDGPPLERSCSNVNGCTLVTFANPIATWQYLPETLCSSLFPFKLSHICCSLRYSSSCPSALFNSLCIFRLLSCYAAAMDAAEAHFSGHNSGVKSSVSTPVAGPSRYILFISVNSIH